MIKVDRITTMKAKQYLDSGQGYICTGLMLVNPQTKQHVLFDQGRVIHLSQADYDLLCNPDKHDPCQK